jgi:hypothetical protein
MPSLLMLLPMVTEEGAGVTPYVVGVGSLSILLVMLVAVLAFGKGREHS